MPILVLTNFSVENGITNGTIGVVKGYDEKLDNLIIEVKSKLHHYPLYTRYITPETKLVINFTYAWAITIHKSQGMTLENVHLDFEGMFTEQLAYVALRFACEFILIFSRITNAENLSVSEFDQESLKDYFEKHKVQSIVSEFYNRFKK
jgi:hypothetical protein